VDILYLLTAGSVDDGKSTLIGRLLYDRDLVFEDHLEALRKTSMKSGSAGADLDFSLLCDGLKSEREQGITIDVAYRYFATDKRKFIIADCPGHEQYTRNMATGASNAELAIILIDAENGVLPQTRRHSFIATLLGIKHVVVAVNKMDLVDYNQEIYDSIKATYTEFAAKLEISDVHFIPISALKGDNVVHASDAMPWYGGSPLLTYLESVHIASDRNFLDFRFPVQHVIRPDGKFRGYAGTVASGLLRPGDEVVALPSGLQSKVKTIKSFDGDLEEIFPPLAVTIEIEDNIDISRGDMLVKPGNLPDIADAVEAMVVWMDERPLEIDREYTAKHLTTHVSCAVADIRYRIDINEPKREDADKLDKNEIGRVLFSFNQPLAFDSYSRNRSTGRFILIDRLTNRTVGAAMIMDRQTIERHRPKPLAGSLKSPGLCLWLTGFSGSGKTTIARALEKELRGYGLHIERLDGDTLRNELCSDLGFSADDRLTNIKRAMFVAKLLSRNGVIAIASFISPYQQMRDLGREEINNFVEVFVDCPIETCEQRDPKGLYKKARAGEIRQFTGIDDPYEAPSDPDIILKTNEMSIGECVDKIYGYLVDKNLIML